MKKLIATLFLISAGIAMLACSSFSSANTTTAGTLSTTAALLADEQNLYAVQAVSASELLISSQETLVLAANPLSLMDQATVSLLEETTADEPIVASEIDVVDQYLSMMEQFLGDNNGLTVTVLESDRVEYANKVNYTTKNLMGNDVTYTLYYNEVLYEEPVIDPENPLTTTTTTAGETTVSEETTTTTGETTTTTAGETTTFSSDTTAGATTTTSPLSMHEQDRNREFEFEDENDNEVLYSISGILIVGDLTYNLEGKKVIEDEEEVFSLRSFIDHENYVKVRFQTDIEDGEQKFFYEVKTAGILVNKSKVQVETDPEDGQLKVKLEFVEGDASGKYEFKQEIIENVTYIKIKYEVESADGVQEQGSIHLTATTDVLTGIVTYEYILQPDGDQNGHMIEKEHENHHGEHGEGGQNGHGNSDNPDDGAEESEDPEDDVTVATGDDVVNG